MNILTLCDIHNDVENIITFLEKLSELKFDVIVCPGDFTDIPQKGFTRADITNLVLEELSSLKKPILAIPGNQDKEIINVLEKRKVSIHGEGEIIDGVGFYGFGGGRTPFDTPLEPTEDEIQDGLEKAFKDVKNTKTFVQVTHMPPARTKLDGLYGNAHVGSEAARDFIMKKHPVLSISAHLHELRGVDELGKTKLINSGRFPEGYCGLVTIEKNNIEAKIINLI